MVLEITPTANDALRAAQNWHIWGRWAAIRYAIKRHVPLRLLGLAVALEELKRKVFGK